MVIVFCDFYNCIYNKEGQCIALDIVVKERSGHPVCVKFSQVTLKKVEE